jgi:sugar fermentation stimulation protein A
MAAPRYLFQSALVEGTITSRPNRFIMVVDVEGEEMKCHCPSTGRIGSIGLEGIPCLLSKGDGGKRKTGYTVEAISLDPPDKKKKHWIGINQGKANAYVEFFLGEGLMPRLFGPVASLKREVKLGDSRLDFLVNDKDYLEVKTPLKDIPCEGHPSYKKSTSKFTSFERLVKHFCDISGAIKNGSRAIVLICYMYDAPPFIVPVPDVQEWAIVEAARKATAGGVEHWQVNLELDGEGVGLTRYFQLKLF